MKKARARKQPKRDWTEQELRQLRNLYHDHTAPQLSRMLGHSEDAIYRKASSLGLLKQRAATEDDGCRPIFRSMLYERCECGAKARLTFKGVCLECEIRATPRSPG